MAITIQDPEADRLAFELTELTGLTTSDAILNAMREQLKRESIRPSKAGMARDLQAIGQRCAALPDLDSRTPEEILGFDEHGLPS